MKIALLFGGRGAERAVSLRSAEAVLPRLRALGHTVFPVFVNETGALFHTESVPRDPASHTGSPLTLLVREGVLLFETATETLSPETVFSLIHGLDGEDGAWQGLFTLTRTPFIGAGVTASAIGMNKRITKELAAARGIPTVPYLCVGDAEGATVSRILRTFSLPLFVKPATGGSSVGVSRVTRKEELAPAILRALGECEEVLIEEAVIGSEIEVAVLERSGMLLLSPPGEIRTEEGFYDYEAKYGEKEASFHLPAPLTQEETSRVKQLAATVFRLLGCRDMARVDLLRREDGEIYFNEINTIPGFTEDSLFPRLFSLIHVDPLLFLTEGRA